MSEEEGYEETSGRPASSDGLYIACIISVLLFIFSMLTAYWLAPSADIVSAGVEGFSGKTFLGLLLACLIDMFLLSTDCFACISLAGSSTPFCIFSVHLNFKMRSLDEMEVLILTRVVLIFFLEYFL